MFSQSFLDEKFVDQNVFHCGNITAVNKGVQKVACDDNGHRINSKDDSKFQKQESVVRISLGFNLYR